MGSGKCLPRILLYVWCFIESAFLRAQSLSSLSCSTGGLSMGVTAACAVAVTTCADGDLSCALEALQTPAKQRPCLQP